MKMPKLRWFVFSEFGWTPFSLGFCCEDSVAAAQLSIFAARYPDRVFIFQE